MPKQSPARRASKLVWYHRNKQQRKDYDTAHREEINARASRWAKAHPETTALCLKRWKEKNYEHVLEYGKQYREAHHEQHKEYNRQYAHNHREYFASFRNRRKAQKLQTPVAATLEQERAIKALYKFRCAYCGSKPKVLTIDHVIPLSKGGPHVPANLVPACPSCNSSKGSTILTNPPMLRLLI